ncbi:MAG: Gfo/Idh/MocA family oxidoreductase [Lachnospiraceae bacterium]|nr:Gfo/Idh/MocA family oxidoreductase [Lachnospiraceae bacterium]
MNIGVYGTGTIASWCSSFIGQINSKDIVMYGCATSPGFDATEFAEKWGWKKVYSSLEDMLEDDYVDVVYVAVPNHLHKEVCLKAIDAGKGVICEKPFAMNYRETKEIVEAAKEKDVFCTEALWPSFLPIRELVLDEIKKGTIGEVVGGDILQLDNSTFLPRVMDINLGGGSILDEGPYAIGAMVDYFGTDIQSVHAHVRKFETGVDAGSHYQVEYQNGVTVFVHQTMDWVKDQHLDTMTIIGTKGKIWMNAVANPSQCIVYNATGDKIKEIMIPEQLVNQGMPPVSGYEHEWIAIEKAFRSGKKETDQVPHEKTLTVAKVMSEIRRQGEMLFPGEEDLF